MSEERAYEHSYTPPAWWMSALRELVDGDDKATPPVPGWYHKDLAAAASARARRDPAWDTTRVTKFLQGRNMTLELTLALSAAVGLPPPFTEARSAEEAAALVQTRRRFDRQVNPDTLSKVSAIADRLDAAVQEVRDQTTSISSSDEGRSGSRGSGRVTGRR